MVLVPQDCGRGRALNDEQGSVLPLLIGLLGLVAMLAGGVVNLSTLYLSHRALYQIADSAALEAVTSLDQERYYRFGAGKFVPTQDQARIISKVIAQSQLSKVEVDSLKIEAGTVTLVLAHEVTLPWPFLVERVVVRARASAVAALKPEQVP